MFKNKAPRPPIMLRRALALTLGSVMLFSAPLAHATPTTVDPSVDGITSEPYIENSTEGLGKLFDLADTRYSADVVVTTLQGVVVLHSNEQTPIKEFLSENGYTLKNYRDENGVKVPAEFVPNNGSTFYLVQKAYKEKFEKVELPAFIEEVETTALLIGETEELSEGEDGIALKTVIRDEQDGTVVETFTVVKKPTSGKVLTGTAKEDTKFFKSLLNPLPDHVYTSHYGMRVHPVTGVYKIHDGLDIGAPCGTPIVSSAGGTVTSVNFDGAYGNRVIVDHGNGLQTAYAHLSAFSVEEGTAVKAGEQIGLVGTTGSSTGCHLHFMVFVDSETKNPEHYFK